LLQLIRENKIPLQYVPREKIERVTRKNHQGVVAFISEITYFPVEELITSIYEKGNDPLLLILDGVSDVRNFGAIARSAECLGFNGIIIPEKGAASVTADAIKTSAGALMKIPVSRVRSLPNTIKFLKDSGIRIYAATEKAQKTAYDAVLAGPLAMVLGSEDIGISENILFLADEQLKIPLPGETESLNVSVAAGILMYEVLRQRNFPTTMESAG
jgi:23S rRNA (guanosine2251-2'-O)-methyltransferase